MWLGRGTHRTHLKSSSSDMSISPFLILLWLASTNGPICASPANPIMDGMRCGEPELPGFRAAYEDDDVGPLPVHLRHKVLERLVREAVLERVRARCWSVRVLLLLLV